MIEVEWVGTDVEILAQTMFQNFLMWLKYPQILWFSNLHFHYCKLFF